MKNLHGDATRLIYRPCY